MGAAEASQAISKLPGPSGASRVSDADIDRAAQLLAAGPCVAFTGAGVSAESGVPTYRDPGGLWKKFDMKKVSHIRNFLLDPIACWRFELELYRVLQGVEPNPGHAALAELEAAGVVKGVVTQNVEGLHTRAGSKTVVELHGNETRGLCLKCGKTCPAEDAFRSVGWLDKKGQIIEDRLPDVASILRKEGDDASSSSSSPPSSPLRLPASPPVSAAVVERPPEATLQLSPPKAKAAAKSPPGPTASSRSSSSSSSASSSDSPDPLPRGDKAPAPPPGAPGCPSCGGLLKPDATYFGEKLDAPVLRHAEKLFRQSGVALIIGSSCRVAPASVLPLLLRKRGGKLIDVNPEAPAGQVRRACDIHLRGPSAEVLPRLARAVAARLASAAGEEEGKAAPAAAKPRGSKDSKK